MILTIAIVAYNEEKFLPTLLNDIKKQNYDKAKMEILLIDSMSTDKTKKIMMDFKNENSHYYNVNVLDNPGKIQSAGWNVAIKNFTGDVLARIDAHTRVTPDYSKYVMENILDGEDVVGGKRPNLIEKEDQWSKVLLQVESSLFGSSINKSRRSESKTYVKTMFHAAYRRKVLEDVGFFNEKLLRTEDNEFHYRVREAGYKLCYDPRIISYQFARPNFRSMVKQKFANGEWIGKTVKVCPGCLSLYHLIPFIFFISIIFSLVLYAIGIPIFIYIIGISYGLFTITGMIISIINDKFYLFSLLIPIMFLILHLSYGLGTVKGLLSRKIKY